MNYAYVYNYGPVLDRTVWSSLASPQTGPDWTVFIKTERYGLFISLHFQAQDRTIFYSPV